MKKLLFLMLVPFMLIANEKMVINYWTLFSGGDSRPMQFIVDKYNSSQDKVVVNFKVILWAEYHKKLKENIHKKDVIDVAVVPGSKLAEFVNNGQLTPLDQFAKKAGVDWNEFTADTKDLVTIKNNHYAIPIDTHLLLTYYNKKLLKEAGLIDLRGDLKEPVGKEGLISFFKKIKTAIPKEIKTLGQPINNVFPFWLWFSIYNQMDNEGYIEGKKALFNNEKALKALEVLTALRDNGIYSDFITDNEAYNLFKFNKSAVFFTGVWSTWNYEQNEKLDFGVAPFPKVFDHKGVWADSHTLVIPNSISSDEKKIEALKFANFVANEGVEWSVAGHIPSIKRLLEAEQYKKKKLRYQYSKYLSFAKRLPKHPKVWECNDKLIEIFADMMQSEKSAKETLELANKEVVKILNR